MTSRCPEPRNPRQRSHQERASAPRPRDRRRRSSRTRSAAVAPRGPFLRPELSTAATQSASDMAPAMPLEPRSRSRSDRAISSLLPRLWACNRPDHTHRRTVSAERPASTAAAATSSSSDVERGMPLRHYYMLARCCSSTYRLGSPGGVGRDNRNTGDQARLGGNISFDLAIQAGRYLELSRRTRSARRASASASTTRRRERVDHIHIRVSAEPDVPAVNPPYSLLPHQRNEVRVGHVVSACLVAARLTEQLPKSFRLAWRPYVRPLEKGFGVGSRVVCAKRLREDRGVRNDSEITRQNRPEQIQKVGSSR